MRIAINGTGIAGPALAWWLRRDGHEPVLFERAPRLRTGGYLIDFWGLGYDIAEKMGVLPALQEQAYRIKELRLVDGDGQVKAGLGTDTFAALTNNRFLSIARGDIAATLFHACEGVPARFGVSVSSFTQDAGGVEVHLTDGSAERFDLLVGADGLHSHVRSQAFGPASFYLHPLGFHVAAFRLRGYRPRDEDVYLGHTEPRRQVMRVSLRDDVTAFFFIFRDEAVEGVSLTHDAPRDILRHVFGGMEWEVPHILERLDEVDELYFDTVSQIRMDRWTEDRVALIGDAAACASLLAGEGTGLALVEAYVLAGELRRAGGDYGVAFRRYEDLLRPFLTRKQKAAQGFTGFFAPRNQVSMMLRDLGINLSSLPFLAKWFAGETVRDDLTLPDYGREA